MSVSTRAADRDMLQILQASFSSSHGSSQPMGWTRHSRRGRTVYNPKVGAMALHPFPVSTSPLSGTKTAMSTLRRLLVVVLALVALAPGLAGQSPAAGQSAIPKLEFEKYTLPNGLQVILHVDRKLPIVHVNQWFHVGSKNEKRGRTGFAHLFEHMMFQGSKNASDEYFVYAEKAGANLAEGGVNGTTSNDRTNYFATVPSGNLENLLWLESDRLATLLDTTDIKKLDEQRNVVKNERRQGLENQPYGRWFPLLFENTFDNGHPYSWPTIGSMEDLSAATLDDVKDFFRQYYTPNNLSLVIAGDFDPAEAKKLVAEVLRRLAAGHPARPAGQEHRDARRRARRRSERPRLARARLLRMAGAGVLQRWRHGPRHRRADSGRRAVVAPEQGAGLRQAAGHAGVRVQRQPRDRQRIRRAGDGAAGHVTEPDRKRRHGRNRAAGQGRPVEHGARACQDQTGSRVRLRAGADRRVWRQGRRAQPVQRVPGRPEQDRGRPGQVPGAHARGRAASCRQVDRHAQQGRDPFPS